MTDEAFRSADGMDLRVTMSGLNAGNKAAMLECLSRYYSTGSDDPLKIVDESFVDAEKWDVYDDQRYYYYNDDAVLVSNSNTKGISSSRTAVPIYLIGDFV